MMILRLVRCQDCSRICNFSRRVLNFISKSSTWNLTVWCHWANITFKCKKFGIHNIFWKIVSNWCSTIFNWYSTSSIVTRCLQMLFGMFSIASRRKSIEPETTTNQPKSIGWDTILNLPSIFKHYNISLVTILKPAWGEITAWWSEVFT